MLVGALIGLVTALVLLGPIVAPSFQQCREASGTLVSCWFTTANSNGDALTALTTIVIAGFTWALTDVGRRQTVLAENSADAYRVVERAYVKLSHRAPGVDWHIRGHFAVNIRVKNFGRTPAEVTDVLVAWRTLPIDRPLPTIPDYNSGSRQAPPTRAFLVCDDEYTHQQRFEMPAQTKEVIAQSMLRLIIFGYVDYIDKFGKRHRAGYARVYDPEVDALDDDPERNNLPFVTEPGYNYDRPRVEGEGVDWG